MKQVYHNTEKCYISFYRLGNQNIFVCLQIKYCQQLDEIWMNIRILDEILDAICDYGRTKNDILDDIFVVSLFI